MHEFEKLKRRLKNVSKGATEYRMSVKEAHDLVAEVEELISQKKESVVVDKVPEVVVKTRILDGGSL